MGAAHVFGDPGFRASTYRPPLTAVRDDLDCFVAAGSTGVHERIVAGGRPDAAKHPDFAAVNTALGNLRAAFAATCHLIDFAKDVARYLADFQFRMNHRYRADHILTASLSSLVCADPRTSVAMLKPELGCWSALI